MARPKLIGALALFAAFFFSISSPAQVNPTWTNPFPPFRIAGNLYYVGSEDLASYLIVTPQGDILINSNLTSSPPLIRKSVESLGFHFKDIKILLISHAHYDHCAGSAEILRETHAKYEVMAPDVSVVESGGRTDFNYSADKSMQFPPTHVDRILHDGDKVSLGGTVLTAHLTAGHTKGTTTWTLDEPEAGRTLHVVIVGSPNVNPGYKLVRNKTYPQIATDYRRRFSGAQEPAMRRFPRRSRRLLRAQRKVPALESRRPQRLHRSCRLQSLHRRPRAGLRIGIEAARWGQAVINSSTARHAPSLVKST